MLITLLYAAIMLAFVSALALALNPVLGIIVVTLSKPVIDTAFYAPLLFGLSLTQIFGVVMPIFILGHMIIAKRLNRLRYMPLRTIWIIIAVDAFLFSGIIAIQQDIMAGLEVFFRHMNGFIGFYMFQAFFREEKKMRMLFIAMILAGIFPISTTLYQILSGTEWHHLSHMETAGGLIRSAGFYYHILTVRYYVYQTLIGMLLYWSVISKPRVWGRAVGGVILATSLIVLFYTYSKAALLEMAIWAFLWTTLQKKFTALIAILVAVLIIIPFYAADIGDVIYTVFQKEVGALTTGKQTEIIFAGRLFMWQVVMERWGELNLFLQVFGSGQVMTGAHNDFIMMLFHGGIVGFLIYIALLVIVGFRLVTELLRKIEPLGVVALILYLSFLVETVGLAPSSYPHFQWLVWGLIGLFLRRREDSLASPMVQQHDLPPRYRTPS
jgi:hypothetical protein